MSRGFLRTRKWADKQGIERYTTEIHVDSVQPLVRALMASADPQAMTVQGKGEETKHHHCGGFPEGADDDLPY